LSRVLLTTLEEFSKNKEEENSSSTEAIRKLTTINSDIFEKVKILESEVASLKKSAKITTPQEWKNLQSSISNLNTAIGRAVPLEEFKPYANSTRDTLSGIGTRFDNLVPAVAKLERNAGLGVTSDAFTA
jgi:hypothetical protein